MIRGGGPTEEWKPVPSYHEMVKERLGLAQKKGEVQVQDRWLSCLLARRTNRVRCTFFAAFRKIVSKEKSVRRHLASRRSADPLPPTPSPCALRPPPATLALRSSASSRTGCFVLNKT